ncbi:MAG: ROK family protein [Ignavibacteria bacterium]|nr:ROK family protein [Ignavibacteria bacterium]
MPLNESVVVGIDIGGTFTKYGFVDKDGNVLNKNSIRTNEFNEFDSFIKTLYKKIQSEKPDKLEIIGYGIGAPNANYYTGYIEEAPNLKWKGRINIVDNFRELCGKPVFVTNDANAGAIGEKEFGGAKELNNFIFITLGTGLGSGFYCDGKLLYGNTGHAGELGHTIIFKNGRQCNCGRKGCLETYVSSTGITRTVIELIKSGKRSVLENFNESELDSKKVFDAALINDEVALEAFDFTADVLALALANVSAVVSPQAIFLYGGLSNAGDLIFKPVRKYFDEYLLNVFKNSVIILPSKLPQDIAAILGAAALCFNELKKLNNKI